MGIAFIISYICNPFQGDGFVAQGRLAEWLGAGLQNRLQRFESATDLNSNLQRTALEVFSFC